MSKIKKGIKSLDMIHFVHCALPDIALNSVDMHMRVGSVTLDVPILVMVKTAEEVEHAEDKEYGINAAFVLGNKVHIVKNGKNIMLNGYELQKVDDGLEAAKLIRINSKALPCIGRETARKSDEIIKQLKMAMFLTNSKDISALRRAPIYLTR